MKNVNWRWVGVAAIWGGVLMAGLYAFIEPAVREQIDDNEEVYESGDRWPVILDRDDVDVILGGDTARAEDIS